jgi:integrase
MQCRNARPKEKPYKLSDAHGLYLYVTPAGTRSWRWKYRWQGRERKLTFGIYPEVSLIEARERREAARKLLRQGCDPGAPAPIAPEPSAAQNFEAIAREWHKVQAAILSERYAQHILDRLEANVFPAIGAMKLPTITPAKVLEVVRAIEARGAIDMARRVRQHMSAVFVYAIASGLAESDPAHVIQAALKKRNKRNRPALIKIGEARDLLRKVEALNMVFASTKLASRLLALTAVRPGVLRLAELDEFEDLDGLLPIWRIPAEKMKLTQETKADATYQFVVPLSLQAVETVKAAARLSAGRPYLFPNTLGSEKPISDSTLSKAYRDAGYRGRHVPHGWRSTFSTIMNELAAENGNSLDREIIDLMLAHIKGDVEAAYNRAAYMPRRRELAQLWADMLTDGLRPIGRILPPAAT